jgi:hypothetical protein
MTNHHVRDQSIPARQVTSVGPGHTSLVSEWVRCWVCGHEYPTDLPRGCTATPPTEAPS